MDTPRDQKLMAQRRGRVVTQFVDGLHGVFIVNQNMSPWLPHSKLTISIDFSVTPANKSIPAAQKMAEQEDEYS